MAAIRSRLSFANVMAVLAVFIALGGTATAALVVTSNSQVGPGTISGHRPPPGDHPNLIDGSIVGRDLGIAVGADGVTNTNKISSTGSFQTVAKTTVRVTRQGSVMLVNGAVEIDNTANSKSATVNLRALMNGKAEPGNFTTTVAPGTRQTGLAFFSCDESPGTYTVELQARGSGVSFNDRTLGVELAPQI